MMKKLVATGLLGLSLNAVAQPLPADAESWVQAIRDKVKTERVLLRKSALSDKTDIALTIPAPEMLAEPGKLNEAGRQVLESAETYAKQAGSKLKVLLPEGQPSEKPDDCSGPAAKNVVSGGYVYIFIK